MQSTAPKAQNIPKENLQYRHAGSLYVRYDLQHVEVVVHSANTEVYLCRTYTSDISNDNGALFTRDCFHFYVVFDAIFIPIRT